MLEMMIIACTLTNGVESCEMHKFHAVGQTVEWCIDDMKTRIMPALKAEGVEVRGFGCRTEGGRES